VLAKRGRIVGYKPLAEGFEAVEILALFVLVRRSYAVGKDWREGSVFDTGSSSEFGAGCSSGVGAGSSARFETGSPSGTGMGFISTAR
jgi:hypothetical protein